MHNALVRPIMTIAYCILHISAFVKKKWRLKEKRKADRTGAMKKMKKTESAVRDDMKSNEKRESKKNVL